MADDAKLLDEFLEGDDITESDVISDLKNSVDQALIRAYKG